MTNRVLLDRAPYGDADGLRCLIREAALEAGLGLQNPDTPFTDFIERGMTVLLKPNWVLHRNEGGHGMACMVTHPEFILAALNEVLKARPDRVILADAPIQSCLWPKLVTSEFCQRAHALADKAGVRLEIIDLRRTIVPTGNLQNGVQTNRRDESRYVLFDLGGDSLLEPITTGKPIFRVTNYDPRKLAQTHGPKRHQYLLCREAFEADVILSLPKLKLHRKAGITAALKNLVGLNGNKDFLPHHRVGGSASGGDCYAGRSLRKRFAEVLLDAANRSIGKPSYGIWNHLAVRNWMRIVPEEEGSLEGAWHGNDTCWRMVLDLNRILLYGKADGTLSETRQRDCWSLTDAIVCGEGEGPLSPQPLTLGAVTFSNSSAEVDAVHCALLHLDENCIPLVREAFGAFRWPLIEQRKPVRANFRGRALDLETIAKELGRRCQPPLGWRGHIERKETNDCCYSS